MNVLQEAIEKLNITMVIMCGIAFGTNRNKTALGDIIVSRQVWNYEPAKVKPEGLAYRGDKVNAASHLLQCFKMAAADYQDMPKIHFGLMASGEKLVNDREFREKLSVQEPELVAGDMEAAGLASVCMSKKVDWIVVKALCDWGENKSDKFQEEAAWNAAEVVVLTVKGYLLPA